MINNRGANPGGWGVESPKDGDPLPSIKLCSHPTRDFDPSPK